MQNNRLVWIDALNIVACMGVLLLHSTAHGFHGYDSETTLNWGAGIFAFSFFIWPVDVFFMLTGYTLIRKSNVLKFEGGGVKCFYSRRLERVLVPIVFWALLYMVIAVARQYRVGEPVDSPLMAICNCISFKYNENMWFLVPLICIYLSLPFVTMFVVNSSRRLLKVFLVISLILGFLNSVCGYPWKPSTMPPLLSVSLMCTQYMPFVVAGYYLGNFELSALFRKRLYFLGMLSVAIMMTGCVLCHIFGCEYYEFFTHYVNLPCTISAYAVTSVS